MIVVSPGSTELKNMFSSNACAGMSKKLIIRQKILLRPLVDGYDKCWKAYCSGHECVNNAEWMVMDFRYMMPWKSDQLAQAGNPDEGSCSLEPLQLSSLMRSEL